METSVLVLSSLYFGIKLLRPMRFGCGLGFSSSGMLTNWIERHALVSATSFIV